jgi:hypothetical protein
VSARGARANWKRGALGLGLLGGTLGPALDAIHTHTGTTWYAAPSFAKSVWWCPPLFAGAALAIGLLRPLLERRLGIDRPAPPARTLWLAMALFVTAYALSGLLPFGWLGKSVVLASLFGVTWALADRTAVGAAAAAVSGFGGWAVEFGLVSAGLFSHKDTELAGVAAWIPWLYACGAIAVGNLGKALVVPGPRSAPESPAVRAGEPIGVA